MALLPPVSDAEATGLVAEVFQAVRRMQGGVPNSIRTMANWPDLLPFYIAFRTAVHLEGWGSLDRRTKELAIIKTSQLNRCHY